MWTSTLTKPEHLEQYLPKDTYIIQIWETKDDPQVKNLLDKDYRVIISNYDGLYLDCGNEAWVTEGSNWCSPFIGWQKVYENSPLGISGPEKQKNVLGAEAALWTEQVLTWFFPSFFWYLLDFRWMIRRLIVVYGQGRLLWLNGCGASRILIGRRRRRGC